MPPGHVGTREGSKRTQNDKPTKRKFTGQIPRAKRRKKRKNTQWKQIALPWTKRCQKDKSRFPRYKNWGDKIVKKKDGVLRVITCNLGGLDINPCGNVDVSNTKEFIKEYEADVIGMQEPNINWKKMPHNGQPSELFRTENKMVCMTACNKHENFTRRNYGGTITMAVGEVADQVALTGEDDTGLGRWTWLLIEGKKGKRTRIVTGYQPCKSREGQLLTVYQQHRRYLQSIRDPTEPRKAFIRDLSQTLRQWREEGDSLIVMLDANEDIRGGRIAQVFKQPDLELYEVSQKKHETLPYVPTYYQGEKGSAYQIDGIFTTPEIEISRVTWVPVDESPGDHRAGIVDLKWDTVAGEALQRVKRPKARRLTGSLPETVNKYVKYLEKYFWHHKLSEKVQTLYRIQGEEIKVTAEAQALLEQIDRVRTDGMLAAEKRCRKLRMGSIDFSPAMNKLKIKWGVLSLIIRKRMGGRVNTRVIKRRAMRCNLERPGSLSLNEALRERDKVEVAWGKLKPSMPGMRRAFLWEKANCLDPKKSKEAKAAARLIAAERARDGARSIHRVLEKQRSNSVSQVMDSEGQKFSTEKEVVETIMQVNSERFRQTETTTLRKEPFRSLLGMGETEYAQAVLNGEAGVPEGTKPELEEFLKFLKRPEGVPPTRIQISTKDYDKYWKKAKERTSSSWSGLHFGHWKAAQGKPAISQVHAAVTQFVVMKGTTLPRWQKGLSVMLEKEQGNIKAEKLRAILLMEADFNFANKLAFGNRMQNRAEDKKLLPDECYGSRAGRKAVDLALNRRLYADISRQRRVPMAIASVDATSCYDRIVHAIASICCQRWGVQVWAVMSMFLTIQNIQFHLRTAFGDTENYYGGTTDRPFQGVCQGNGAGPAVWLAISATLIQWLQSLGHYTILEAAITKVKSSLSGLLFVDDTDLVKWGDNAKEELQLVVKDWQQALEFSGGALKAGKCSWSVVEYVWKHGKWKYKKINDHTDDEGIFIKQNGNLVRLKAKEPTEAIKVVGVVQALDGSMKGQIERLKGKALQWAKLVEKGWLPRALAWQCIRTHIWSSLRYPLAVTTLSEEEAWEIVREMYTTILPSLGLNSRFPTTLRWAARSHLGLNLPHPYIEQGIEQLKMILGHLSSPRTPTGDLIQISLEQAQVELGLPTAIWKASYKKHNRLITESWVKSIWEFVDRYDIEVCSTDKIELPLLREKDRYLMEIALEGGFNDQERISINRCRCHMQAITVADIATGDGRYIAEEVYNCTGNERGTPYIFPREQPSRSDIRVWKNLLNSISTHSRKLKQPLGLWMQSPVDSWVWFWSPTSGELFSKNSIAGWHKFAQRHQHGTRYEREFRFVEASEELPDGCQRATVKPISDKVVLFLGAAGQIKQSQNAEEDVRVSGNLGELEEIAIGISRSQVIGVTDGSYMAERSKRLGAAAWILEDQVTLHRVQGECQTTGSLEDVNSYRSELQGIYSIVRLLRDICKKYDVKKGEVKIFCDNKGALHTLGRRVFFSKYQKRHADLVRAITATLCQLPIEVVPKHVYGHQDDQCEWEGLSREAQLNTVVDRRAKEHLENLIANEAASLTGPIPDETWWIQLNRRKLSGAIEDPIRHHISEREVKTYMVTKGKMTADAFDMVDWENLGRALKLKPELFGMWACKQASGFCATAKKLYQMRYWESAMCPCCGIKIEDTHHFASCINPVIELEWEKQLTKLLEWLENAKTCPSIIQCIQTALDKESGMGFRVDDSVERVKQAAVEQEHIGKFHFLEGKVSKKWMVAQERYWKEQKEKRSPKRWAVGLIGHLLEFTHNMWVARNGIVHERASNGLKLKESRELEAAVREQYHKGYHQLAVKDHHFMDRSLSSILGGSAVNQQVWLRGIEVARKERVSDEEVEEQSLREAMASWLGGLGNP